MFSVRLQPTAFTVKTLGISGVSGEWCRVLKPSFIYFFASKNCQFAISVKALASFLSKTGFANKMISKGGNDVYVPGSCSMSMVIVVLHVKVT